jgi:hypothetical protein
MILETPVERFKSLANRLSYETLHFLDDLYTEDIVFIDPVGEFRGLPAVRDYYARLYEGVKTISFAFEDEVRGGGRSLRATHSADATAKPEADAGGVEESNPVTPKIDVHPGDAVLFWTMRMEHKRFRKGETVALPGCSHLKFKSIPPRSEIPSTSQAAPSPEPQSPSGSSRAGEPPSSSDPAGAHESSSQAETPPTAQIKICYHRDYYDLGALLYERIPILGSLIRSIKARL